MLGPLYLCALICVLLLLLLLLLLMMTIIMRASYCFRNYDEKKREEIPVLMVHMVAICNGRCHYDNYDNLEAFLPCRIMTSSV